MNVKVNEINGKGRGAVLGILINIICKQAAASTVATNVKVNEINGRGRGAVLGILINII